MKATPLCPWGCVVTVAFQDQRHMAELTVECARLRARIAAARTEVERLQSALDWMHDCMYPDDPLSQGVLRAVLEQRPWESGV